MPRFLSPSDAQGIEHLLDLTMEEIDDDDPRYAALYNAYNAFEPQSNTAATIAEVVAAIRLVNNQRADQLEGAIFERIRQNNYPSAWNTTATQAKDTYVTNHPGGNASSWMCPGFGRATHQATVADVTIDHIMPVAQHWNLTGCNTSRLARANWYQDTTNHAYLCRACNSRRGSGGIRYNIAVGGAYTN